MKNRYLLFLAISCTLVLAGCKKESTEVVETPVKTFQFPFKITQYKIEPEGPVRVYIKTDWNVKKEIFSYDPAILEHPVFKSTGKNVLTSITFENEEWAKTDPKCVNDRIHIYKNGNDFSFTVTIGINSSCKAICHGDYDDLSVDCQAFNIRAKTGGYSYTSDNFRDACFPNQALDCAIGDTVAILNYKIFLKKG